MPKTILITGATDGIGLETARRLVSSGHCVLVHGRNPRKLEEAGRILAALPGAAAIETIRADLSRLAEVEELADHVAERHSRLDVLINNAGVYNAAEPRTVDGLDVRFAVNTVAPYLLARRLLPLLGPEGRIVNVSSAAQSPVDPEALAGRRRLSDGQAYAQSKLALTMWSRSLALKLGDKGPAVIAVNPASMLGSKMVRDAFGVAGGDIGIGADILARAALSDEFAGASGKYFDNDRGQFGPPHRDALDTEKSAAIVAAIDAILARSTEQGAAAGNPAG